MAYNSFYQPTYPYYQPPQINNFQNSSSSIIWVQGVEGAKAYPVNAGGNAILMDSEESVFYIKSTDSSGMPQPLRVFDYVERKEQSTDQYVTREELQSLLAQMNTEEAKDE